MESLLLKKMDFFQHDAQKITFITESNQVKNNPMKQIKVPLTPEQWAEKRLQLYLTTTSRLNDNFLDISDTDIEKCGFYLAEEKQIEPASNGQNTDVDDKDVVNIAGDLYQPLFNFIHDSCGFIAVQDDLNAIVNLCRPIIAHLDKPETKPDEIPTDKVEAVKYFLNQLPSGYKERALAQVDESFVEVEPDNIGGAISFFKDWSETNEGTQFWMLVWNHYENPTDFPTLPPLPNE
jgi:hypothetical protein